MDEVKKESLAKQPMKHIAHGDLVMPAIVIPKLVIPKTPHQHHYGGPGLQKPTKEWGQIKAMYKEFLRPRKRNLGPVAMFNAFLKSYINVFANTTLSEINLLGETICKVHDEYWSETHPDRR